MVVDTACDINVGAVHWCGACNFLGGWVGREDAKGDAGHTALKGCIMAGAHRTNEVEVDALQGGYKLHRAHAARCRLQ